eukprot:CAMPEP_0181201570 /NCGR_PEP_ID=MMETSP1096-20121128/18377_1 /TAXON_ID=156174 ORGANISM="Chrysochromulina ericina, Strain CCMP281" /NCGR_SAMPLE_ID=MMETSP1096 /ASSEMBLY_ACC=CAM_ASM_000453 /LENGTH=112 /DNA_ID=CAMNT_0023292021 /DNA_START=610 /DNA_END=949 /DNA_ORIENTATION=-
MCSGTPQRTSEAPASAPTSLELALVLEFDEVGLWRRLPALRGRCVHIGLVEARGVRVESEDKRAAAKLVVRGVMGGLVQRQGHAALVRHGVLLRPPDPRAGLVLVVIENEVL